MGRPLDVFNIVTVVADTMEDAFAQMRAMGYRSTYELKHRVNGMTVDDMVWRFGMVPTTCRFKKSGKFMNNYFWTEAQEIEASACSIRWLKEQLQHHEKLHAELFGVN